MTSKGVLLVVVAAMLTPGCRSGLYGPSLSTPATPSPRSLDELTVAERRALLDRAVVWQPVETERLDLLAGPAQEGAFGFDERVSCEFTFPKEPLGGITTKFDCAIGADDVVKVKYDEDNGEVYSEVAASRLFWALGFNADRMYPVKVTCRNCPDDPHRASTSEWRLGRPGKLGTKVIDPATIERKFEGKSIEVPGFKGWSWRELDAIADNEVGATRAQIDALKLLAAFIQHVDSKPGNQALVCEDGTSGRDAAGNATCRTPHLVVKDLGSSFAAASKLTFSKMRLASWRGVPVWKNARTCQADLNSSIIGTLQHPRVSEPGRKLLAEQLQRLSDAQLRDLFMASRVELREERVNGRPVQVDDWVQAFKEKRRQVVEHRCGEAGASTFAAHGATADKPRR